jgi:diaminopimelate epimerase
LLADRHLGIGCDQILLVEAGSAAGVDFRYRIFNADGGEVEQCGNGARCFVRFVHEQGLTAKREIRVETMSGVIVPRLEDDGTVTVDMGVPVFAPERIPFVSDSDDLLQTLRIADERSPSPPSAWAIRTPCRWLPTSTPRRSSARGR